MLPMILVQNQIIYIIIGKVHTWVQCASVEVKVIGSYDCVYYVERGVLLSARITATSQL